MLQNYFKTASRNLLRNKVYAAINIVGLAAGIAACILIFLYVKDEVSYDRYNTKADRIYRVTRDFLSNDGTVSLSLGHVAPPFGPLLKQEFPDIQALARTLNSTLLLEDKTSQKRFNEEHVYFAEPDIFKIFTIPVKQGNPEKSLDEPFTVLLSEKMAQKYYPGQDPSGKVLTVNNAFSVKVAGVYEDFPVNAHFHPDFLMSFTTLNDTTIYGSENLKTNWGNNSFGTYFLLPENYPVDKLQAQMPAFLDKVLAGTDHARGRKPSEFTHLYLQKLTDIHLKSHLDSEEETNGELATVLILAAVALVILLIACINYINLSTARSTSRAKEVGVRKVVGALKGDLVKQFLLESVVVAIIATLLGLGLTELSLPWLNDFAQKDLHLHVFSDPVILGFVLLLPLLIGLLAGLYPALYLTRFEPARVLKGSLSNSSKNPTMRKALVIVQFSISIALIIATGVMYRQLLFMQNKALGFDKEKLIVLPYYSSLAPQYEAFKAELMKSSSIQGVGKSLLVPSDRLLNSMGAGVLKGDSMAKTDVTIKYVNVDQDLFDTYKVKLAAGRNFSRQHPTDDSAAFILNETAVKMIGWQEPQQAVDQVFQYGDTRGRIIGVVKDFHFESLHQEIAPMVFLMSRSDSYTNVSIRYSGDPKQALAHIESVWNKFAPDQIFRYDFMDELYSAMYKTEQRKGQIFTVFSCIAIFIACLGLFGLASYTTVQRTKEIGIRKVFGASILKIVTLLSSDFLKLVLIANLLAWPIAWYAMSRWLEDYAYRVTIGTGIFLLAAFLAFIIAIVTISFHAIKAASANPVKALRTE
ncbi:ABC transporter permease [Pontibacter liquoris]|uniref:ABC transporter permease n=1 Tax=Pontibacter liquoris TaxID=2905677 RepID=UPI001FA7A521|nr:ABC transporter permease [Pontibacter liquoris]